MGLEASTIQKIHTYIDEGVPLEDLFTGGAGKANIERVHVAEKVYERLVQDPMLDVVRCLRRTFGRTKAQVAKDQEVIEMFIEALEEPSRRVLMYRARKVAEGLVRTGQQLGDAKIVERGLNKLIQLDQLDKPEQETQNIGDRTFHLPAVFVKIEEIDKKYHSISEEQRKAILAKYGGVEDENIKLVEEKKHAMMHAAPQGFSSSSEEEAMDLTSEDF